MKPQPVSGGENRNVTRSVLGLVAVAVGVALCIRGGISLLVPGAFLVALMPFQKTTSTRRYLLLLSGSMFVAIAVGAVYTALSHKAITFATLVSCGLIFIALGWLQGPGSNRSTT